MATITISRQLGSLGDEVANAIASRLDYQVVSRDIINLAALRAGVPEVGLATIDDLNLLNIHPTTKARQAYQQAVAEVMHEYAARDGYVIIGRAGQVILREHPLVLHIKVIAPEELRATRIAAQQNISLEAALAQVNASDHNRQQYLRRYYHVRWDDPRLYDLIINTARLEPEQAACLICQALTHCIPSIHAR